MANYQPRAQRLRQSRQARSAERELLAKHSSSELDRKPTRAHWEYAKRVGLTDEEHFTTIGKVDPYELRQVRREQDHLKRNARKNNPKHPHPKRPVYSPEELKRRNVLLSLPATKPDSMSWELWKGLLKERKKLFTVSNPPKRGIPDYSAKVTPKRRKPTRYQEVYELSETLPHPPKMSAYPTTELEGYHYVEGKGWHIILGIKRIPHFD